MPVLFSLLWSLRSSFRVRADLQAEILALRHQLLVLQRRNRNHRREPTAEWTAQQLMAAFPWDSAPRYLLRDRDGNYGKPFRKAADWMDIHEVLTAPQSPWQNAYVERFIGSILREFLDHVIVISEAGLRRVLKTYFDYYDRSRTHLALGKDAPAQ